MSAEKQQLRRKIEYLRGLEGRHSSFTTIYVPPTKSLMDTISFVKTEISEADNIKSKQNRKNVQDNLTAILTELTKIGKLPETGIVFFFGILEHGGTNQEIREIIVPPSPVSQFIYVCGREFILEELEDMTKP
ncbi:MAG: peptide chain release factor 1, partial [Candidatus Thorarchaeota archaeon]